MASDRHDQFMEHFVACQERLYGFVATLLPHWDDAQDVFQQTSLILWRKLDQFDPQGDSQEFLRWACRIAKLEAQNYLRRQRKNHIHLSDHVLEAVAQTRLEKTDQLDRRRSAMAGCLDRLEPEQRELLRNCYLGEETIKTLAERLGKTPVALYAKVRRIRRTVMECIERTVKSEDGE